MNTVRWIQFAWRNALRNRRRSAVTVGVAAVGSAAILLAGGFALFTYQSLAEASARSTGHLVMATPAQFDTDEAFPLQHGLEHAEDLQTHLRQDPHVRQILPRVEFTGLISNGDKSTVMVAIGIDPDAEFAIKGPFLSLKSGTVLSSDDTQAVMLGAGLARSLKAIPGSTLTLLATTSAGALNALDVQVRGVVSTGIAELDQRLVYTDVKTAQGLLVSQRVSSLGLFLDAMDATASTRQRLAAQWPELRLMTWEEGAPFYRSVRALYNRIFGALGLIITLIVVIVVINAMAMSIVERTREIGTLLALGTLPRQLTMAFAIEGWMLGSVGAGLGSAIAAVVSMGLLLFPVQMPPPPGRSDGYPLQIALDPTLFSLTAALIPTLSMLAAAWIARQTVRRPITWALAHV